MLHLITLANFAFCQIFREHLSLETLNLPGNFHLIFELVGVISRVARSSTLEAAALREALAFVFGVLRHQLSSAAGTGASVESAAHRQLVECVRDALAACSLLAKSACGTSAQADHDAVCALVDGAVALTAAETSAIASNAIWQGLCDLLAATAALLQARAWSPLLLVKVLGPRLATNAHAITVSAGNSDSPDLAAQLGKRVKIARVWLRRARMIPAVLWQHAGAQETEATAVLVRAAVQTMAALQLEGVDAALAAPGVADLLLVLGQLVAPAATPLVDAFIAALLCAAELPRGPQQPMQAAAHHRCFTALLNGAMRQLDTAGARAVWPIALRHVSAVATHVPQLLTTHRLSKNAHSAYGSCYTPIAALAVRLLLLAPSELPRVLLALLRVLAHPHPLAARLAADVLSLLFRSAAPPVRSSMLLTFVQLVGVLHHADCEKLTGVADALR